VRHVLELLRAELERALVLCGCDAPGQADRDLVHGAKVEEPW
jgi:hypothetical protein